MKGTLANSTTANDVFSSLQVNNARAASGGGDGDSINEIKQNSLDNFQTQLRAVTQDDYLVRALSMPSRYGALSKAYATPEKLEDLSMGEVPSVVNLFVLGYDINKKLNTTSPLLKQNLKTYLSEFRIINDSIKIRDAFIINIGIDFEIIVLPNYNNNEVLKKCITVLKQYFNIDKWQINQPIIESEVFNLIANVKGVQSVINVTFNNLAGVDSGYSRFKYDFSTAVKDGIIYPSLDPSIFEIKFPNSDIKGNIKQY